MFASKTCLRVLGGLALLAGFAMPDPAEARITGVASLAPIAKKTSDRPYQLRAELHRRELSSDRSRHSMRAHLTTNGKRADAALACDPLSIDVFNDSFEPGANL